MNNRNNDIRELHYKYKLPYSICRKAYKIGNYDKANAELLLICGLDFLIKDNRRGME